MTIRASFERVLLENPFPRSSHSLNVVGNRGYLFGGEVKPREPVDSAVHVFDLPKPSKERIKGESTISSRSVVSGNEGPHSRVGHTSARINDDIYIFGGRGGKDMTALQENGRLWKLSTSTEEWKAVDPTTASTSSDDNGDDNFPQARSYHSSTSAPELGKIFIHAGCPASGRESDLWSFDINAKTWKKLESAPAPPRGGPGFTYALGKLWRYGGFDGKNELGGQLDYIDITSNAEDAKWQSVKFEEGHYPGARSVTGLQVISIKNEPFLVAYLGERDASNLGHAGAGVFWADIYSLALTKEGEIASDKWERCEIESSGGVEGKLPERGWFASDIVGESAILVYGGLNARNERESDGILITFS